jgi:hypothetical protein
MDPQSVAILLDDQVVMAPTLRVAYRRVSKDHRKFHAESGREVVKGIEMR